MTDIAVRMSGVVKRFPGVVANDGVELEVRKGEVLVRLDDEEERAILGELEARLARGPVESVAQQRGEAPHLGAHARRRHLELCSPARDGAVHEQHPGSIAEQMNRLYIDEALRRRLIEAGMQVRTDRAPHHVPDTVGGQLFVTPA